MTIQFLLGLAVITGVISGLAVSNKKAGLAAFSGMSCGLLIGAAAHISRLGC